MTQEPHDPDSKAPADPPASAWAPRPNADPPPAEATPAPAPAPATSETPEATSTQPEPVTAAGETPDTAGEPAPALQSEATDAQTVVTPSEQVVAAAPPQHRRGGVPAWLLPIVAIVPAIIVGLLVFILAGDNDDAPPSREAAAVVDGLMRLGRADQSGVSSYAGQLPPEFTADFPMYEGADVVISIAFASREGTGYLIVLSTTDPSSDVYAFYSEALDNDPWQVEIGRASDSFTGLRFLRPDNIDVSGDVSLHQSTIDDRTLIYLSYSDISQAILPGRTPSSFSLGSARPLPVGFPQEIPIYAGSEESFILDTYFERGQGGRAFIVTFLTLDNEDAVINFYRDEFESRGWNVSDASLATTSFALGIRFDDGDNQSFSGTITADAFDDDPTYTQVDLVVTTR